MNRQFFSLLQKDYFVYTVTTCNMTAWWTILCSNNNQEPKVSVETTLLYFLLCINQEALIIQILTKHILYKNGCRVLRGCEQSPEILSQDRDKLRGGGGGVGTWNYTSKRPQIHAYLNMWGTFGAALVAIFTPSMQLAFVELRQVLTPWEKAIGIVLLLIGWKEDSHLRSQEAQMVC
jgi:hypothetical protein